MGTLTTQELQFKLDHLKEFYKKRNSNMVAWRNMYFMTEESIWRDENGDFIEKEPDEERIVTPTAYTTVESFRELLLTKPPVISVPPPTSKGQDLIDAEHNEKALQAIWYRARIYDRLRDSLWHGLVDGWGVMQVVWDKRGDDELPITVLHHDPYNVYPMPGNRPDEWEYVIHAYPKMVGLIKAEWYPDDSEDKRTSIVKRARAAFEGLEDTATATFIEYWTDKVHGIGISFDTTDHTGATKIETRWVKEPTEHDYGSLPWEIYLPSRLPFRVTGEQMGFGILFPIKGSVEYNSRLLSQKATMLTRWQDPPLVTETQAGPDFMPTRVESGYHLRLGSNEKAYYLTHPGPLPQIDSMLAQMSLFIEGAALPKALQGQYEGAMSGIAMSLLRNPTLMKIAFRQKELERACESLDSKMLILLERKLTQPLYLWGKTRTGAAMDSVIDPEKIQGYYRNDVRLSASLPTDDANVVNMLLAMVQGKIISRRVAADVAQQTLHDMVGQSLIDDEMIIMAELALSDPGLAQAIAQAAAKVVNMPYLPKPENPKGGMGDKEITMPSTTLAAQTKGTPGGNTEPTPRQSAEEMMQGSPGGNR